MPPILAVDKGASTAPIYIKYTAILIKVNSVSPLFLPYRKASVFKYGMRQALGLLAFLMVMVAIYTVHTSPYSTQKLERQIKERWSPLLERTAFTVNNKQYLITHSGVVVGGDALPIHNAYVRKKVLSLALLYEETSRDPLFYSPGLNLSNWESVLEKLYIARGIFFQTTSAQTPDEGARLTYMEMEHNSEALYPLAFLSHFVKTARANENFLASPSDILAHNLVQSMELTDQLYTHSIKDHLRLLTILPKKTDVYLFLGSATNQSIIQHDFELLLKNASQLKQEITRRKECLYLGICTEIPPTTMPSADGDVSVTMAEPKIPIGLLTPPHTKQVTGPYLIKSNCWGQSVGLKKQQAWPMYLFISTYRDTTVALPMLANEIFYWNVASSTYPIDREKAGRGIVYNDQIATNMYWSPDNSFYPTILTLSFLQNKISTEGVIVEEERALSENLPSDTLLTGLEEAYAKNTSAESRERRLIVENKLVGFDLSLGKLYEFLHSYTDATIINGRPFAAFSLLGARSSYSLLYMPFARSVWRLPEKLEYVLPGVHKVPEQYLHYHELVERGFNPRDAQIWDTDVNHAIVEERAQKEARGAEDIQTWLINILRFFNPGISWGSSPNSNKVSSK